MPTGAPDEKTAVAGEGIALEQGAELGGVQLWEGGPYWAECNVGATKPEEYGYYFTWGDTVGYMIWEEMMLDGDGGWYVGSCWKSSITGEISLYFPSETCPTYGMDKWSSELQSLGYIDGTDNLVAAYDAATAHLGAPWRMPTAQELADLKSNCDWTWSARNGVNGVLVAGRGGFVTKSIFLPAVSSVVLGVFSPDTGCDYWSSTLSEEAGNCAIGIGFRYGVSLGYFVSRDSALLVRPVRGFAQ